MGIKYPEIQENPTPKIGENPALVTGGLKKIGQSFIIPFLEEGSDIEKDCRRIFRSVPERAYDNSITSGIVDGNVKSDCPEYFELQLPRVYQRGSSLSDHTLLLFFNWVSTGNNGTLVFAFDPTRETLYHVVTKGWNYSDSYAAVGNCLYFVGGSYRHHDVNIPYKDALDDLKHVNGMTDPLITEYARKIADVVNKMNLEVESFNLDRCKWKREKYCTVLNAPKHHPFVFTFNSKIFAIAAKVSSYELGDSFPSFEFLDTALEESTTVEDVDDSSDDSSDVSSVSLEEDEDDVSSVPFEVDDVSRVSLEEEDTSGFGSPTTWYLLPKPPFVGREDTCYVFCKEKNCLYVKVSDNHDEGHISLIWKFDLMSEKWYNDTTDTSDSFYDPQDYEFLSSLTHVPAKHFDGCIVNNILFYFEDGDTSSEKRLLVGHDLRGKKVVPRKWEIDLKHLLRDEGLKIMSGFRFSHIDGFKFCLVINYRPSYEWNVNFLCICTFELSLNDDQVWEEATSQNTSDLDFTPTLLRRLYFQVPNSITLAYHTKLEGGHDSSGCKM